jgi:tetratricopeptide (TPR) repeat protein
MKRFWISLGCCVALGLWTVGQVEGRGGRGGGGGGGARMGGGGGSFGGGGFSGGARPGGGFSMPSGGFGGGGGYGGGGYGGGGYGGGGYGGGGLSGGGYRPPSVSRPSAGGNFGGGNFGGAGQRPSIGGGSVHMPSRDGGNFGLGGRPELGDGGGITRPDVRPGSDVGGARDRFPGAGGGGTATLPGLGSSTRPAAGAGDRLSGDRVGGGAATRPATGAVGDRFSGAAGAGNRLNQGGAGTRFSQDSVPQRHQDLSNQFSDLKSNWTDGDWHSWTGPNGGQINHIGFWGPNGYWGHTGAWGPNGGHVGRSTGIGAGGAYTRTSGWGPNGNYFGRGAAVGPGGAAAWAHGGGPAGYWSRSWGWYNGYGPAWGNGRWDYLWNQYPVAMAFGATMWGLNAVSYAMGVSDYSNPYYDSSGSYPTNYDEPLTGDPSYDTAQAEDAATDPLEQAFNAARAAFQQDQFDQALQLVDEALKQAPRDAALNEFRSLCLFALGQYRDSAATIHAVLAAGPGWDWTTMITMYSNEQVYTQQLRKLEAAAGADPTSADMRFLLAYHYLTADHPDAAVEMWKQVVQINPQDKLSADLLQMYGPNSDTATASAAPLPPDIDKPAYSAEQLAGNWKAASGGGEFALTLNADNAFTWSFTRDGKPQSVTGAYALGGNNLVMQPDTGGTMLSTITLADPDTLEFVPIGSSEKLTFTK